MVFSSLSFLYVFLPAVLLVYYLVPAKAKNAVLLFFSLVFYYVGEQSRVWIMGASSLLDFGCALLIDTHREKKGLCRLALAASLCGNLGLLAYFKYADLIIEGINAVSGAGLKPLKVALPIGISFYTFQTMSYSADVYRGSRAQRNFLDFACYVTLFPQLIAGPIVRYADVVHELPAAARKADILRWEKGIRRFCLGLGKKVILANSLAELVKLTDSAAAPVLLCWLGALAAPLQIYFDFSGYSDMAIGLGHLLGFSFPENFDHPFASRSATEFWQRWHMTLGGWFRDYLYIPLGGSRVGPLRLVFNLMLVWSVTGLWHGASVNFILWGVYYGILIVIERFALKKLLDKPHPAAQILSRAYLLLLSVFGFQIFNAADLTDIGVRLGRLFGAGGRVFSSVTALYYCRSYAPLVLLSLLLSLPWGQDLCHRLCAKSERASAILRLAADFLALALLIVSTAYLVDGSYNPFLYFRF